MAAHPDTRAAFRGLGFLALINALVVALLLLRYWATLPELSGAFANLFALLSLPAHAFFLCLVASSFGALLLTARVPARWALSIAAIPFWLLLVVLAVDSSVYRLYRFHLNGMVWELLTGGAAGEILPLEGAFYALAIAIPVAALLLQWGSVRGARYLAIRYPLPRKLLALLLLSLVAVNGMHVWADASEEAETLLAVRTLPAYYPLKAKRLMRKLGVIGERGDVAVKYQPGKGKLDYPRSAVEPGPGATGQNVLVIMLDGWRADDFNAAVTPRLWEYAQKGLTFTDHWSTGNATRFGVFGFFYGLHATYWHDLLAEQKPPALIEAARKSGYRFGIFASAPLTSPEFDRTVFASVRDRIPLSTPGADVVARDREITSRFKDFLARGGQGPFFSFLFYDSTHLYAFPPDWPTPFTPFEKNFSHLSLDKNTPTEPIRNRLRNSYNFADSLAGEALDELARRGLLEDTVVIITSDHGQEVNDLGENYWGHNSAFDSAQSRVPFVLLMPGRGASRVERRTSHADVAPTLVARVFGSLAPVGDYSNGRDLFDETPRRFVVVSNWDSFALVGRERVDISLPTGNLESRDIGYRRLKGSPPDKGDLVEVVRQLGAFYRK